MAAVLTLGAVGGRVDASPRPEPTILARLVGQRIMTGFAGAQPDAALLARIRAGTVGGVILFGWNVGRDEQATARLVGELQHAAASGGNPPLLVAVDQEGGAVRRLPTGPPALSAAAIGRAGSAARARAEGEATGRYLRRLGIDVDLAPVLDTPSSPGNFLGDRTFSDDAELNARLGSAFVAGLQARRVAGTAKHFPGLGAAPANTDTATVEITASRSALDRGLRPFAAAVRRGAKLVMVSNAAYRAYDGATPALFSPAIVGGLLRRQLGFDGVVITDAMEAPAPSSRATAPVTAARAGADVLLYLTERDSEAAFRQLLAAARSGRLSRGDLAGSEARIAALKRWLER
jgi:beta-N-acetylhexosaminidase